MKIERVENNRIRITESNGAIIHSQTVTANLLFAILEKLEEIKTTIGDDTYRSITMRDPK